MRLRDIWLPYARVGRQRPKSAERLHEPAVLDKQGGYRDGCAFKKMGIQARKGRFGKRAQIACPKPVSGSQAPPNILQAGNISRRGVTWVSQSLPSKYSA